MRAKERPSQEATNEPVAPAMIKIGLIGQQQQWTGFRKGSPPQEGATDAAKRGHIPCTPLRCSTVISR
jgi:hypothetical protein